MSRPRRYDGVAVALACSAELSIGNRPPVRLGARDAVALPPGTGWAWRDWSDDFEMLQVALPDAAVVSAP